MEIEKNIEMVQAKVDIVKFISRFIPDMIESHGRYYGRCPFHNVDVSFNAIDDGKMVIIPKSKIWHCFTCGDGGDIISFFMKYFNATQGDAIEVIMEVAYQEAFENVLKKLDNATKAKLSVATFTFSNFNADFMFTGGQSIFMDALIKKKPEIERLFSNELSAPVTVTLSVLTRKSKKE
jgi:DNA primase